MVACSLYFAQTSRTTRRSFVRYFMAQVTSRDTGPKQVANERNASYLTYHSERKCQERIYISVSLDASVRHAASHVLSDL